MVFKKYHTFYNNNGHILCKSVDRRITGKHGIFTEKADELNIYNQLIIAKIIRYCGMEITTCPYDFKNNIIIINI